MAVPSALIGIAAFVAAAALAAPTSAVCLDSRGVSGHRPELQEEVSASAAIVVGEALGRTDLFEDASDPRGITATLYRVRIVKVLCGETAQQIDVRSENDSGRFPMEIRKRYLLFLGQGSHAYFVNNCGHSGLLLAQSANTLRDLAHLAEGCR
jgi:hypothetical protein